MIGLEPDRQILYAVFPEWRIEIEKGLGRLADDLAKTKGADSATTL